MSLGTMKAQIRAPPETPRTSNHYGNERFNEKLGHPLKPLAHHITMVTRVLMTDKNTPENTRTSQQYGNEWYKDSKAQNKEIPWNSRTSHQNGNEWFKDKQSPNKDTP